MEEICDLKRAADCTVLSDKTTGTLSWSRGRRQCLIYHKSEEQRWKGMERKTSSKRDVECGTGDGLIGDGGRDRQGNKQH